MVSPGKRPLLLTNQRGGGIGDFGLALERHLKSRLGRLEIEETSIDGRGFLRKTMRAATYPGPLIVNLGLTAWGKSAIRNSGEFAAVGFHNRIGHSTDVIVHHVIEIFNPAETGYQVTSGLAMGAHLAMLGVRDCNLIVFSPRLSDILRRQYGARHIWLVPLPGERARKLPKPLGRDRMKVVSVGYWAPYKGIDLFVRIAAQMGSRADFILGGLPHFGLFGDSMFREQVERWKAEAVGVGVRLPGFLGPAELDSVLSGTAVGLLPYTSVSGASASFQLFAERRVPVIASDLPEFRYLESLGAGILLAPPNLDGLSASLGRILEDRSLWSELAERQSTFNERYGWDRFVDGLLNRNKPAT